MHTAPLFEERKDKSYLKAMRIVTMVAQGGGTPLVIGAFFILLYMGYSSLLEWLPTSFPTWIIIAWISSFFLTSNRLRTWIKTADLTYLLPLESEMKGYFRASIRYSIIVHNLHLLLFLFLVYPFVQLHISNFQTFLLMIMLLCLLQTLNGYMAWWEALLKPIRSTKWLRTVVMIRWMINVFCSLTIFKLYWIWFGIGFMGMFALLLFLKKQAPSYPLPWSFFAKQEQSILAKYYRIANWFVDMPQLPVEIKERKIGVRMLDFFFPSQHALTFLFIRNFVRKSEMISIIGRLLIWTSILMIGIDSIWAHLVLIFIGLWMTYEQLPQVTDQRFYPVWYRLYPIDSRDRKKYIRWFYAILLWGQTMLLGIISGWILHSFLASFLTIAWGILITVLLILFRKLHQ
ncbi:ABC transporter permease [Hazenella sp. IB182357]|uniref:ABC transporter permease n=1 Tax=Polycladospora coralii TaxID=2771432 RepID=A0A926N695_9BACL|nr:ABC transporter permease [Polycladospora coralii]MBD1371786.1 ABC transporter permease [Polycladospora coralii]MBS7529247.1 ABC transporter permease [Polycladospora coralii]